MKNGLWIGGVVLALFAAGSDLFAEDSRWRAVDNPANEDAPAATLAKPVALKEPPVNPSMPPAPLPGSLSPETQPGGIQPINFEVVEASAAPSAPPSARSAPEIIAVSAPLSSTSPLASIGDDEDNNETLFAIDRLLRPVAPSRRPTGPIVQAVAGGSQTPALTPPTSELAPNWNADGGGPSFDGPAIEDGSASPFAPVYPMGRRLYLSGEYLLWWLKGDPVPVLATTSAPSDSAILGAPTTTALFGGNSITGNPYSGARFTAGYWLDDCGTKAIEVNGFFLGQGATNFSTNSFTNSVIGRPFLEANNGQESAQLTALPNVATGSVTIHAPTNLWGLGANLSCLLCCGCNYRVTVLAGFRNINLDESLSVTENVQGLATAPAPFTNETITVNDSFATQNHFYGGLIGAAGRWYWGRWSIGGNGTLAIGANAQQLNISGSQQFVSPTGAVQNFTGGLLALPSNIGQFSHTAFSFVPEVGVNVGYQITPYLRGLVGYNFLYWTNVIRPGTSIDRSLDVTQIPNFALNPEPAPVPGLHPAAVFHETNFWAQGITLGLQFTY